MLVLAITLAQERYGVPNYHNRKIQEIGKKLKDFEIDGVFINDSMNFVQKKNLESYNSPLEIRLL